MQWVLDQSFLHTIASKLITMFIVVASLSSKGVTSTTIMFPICDTNEISQLNVFIPWLKLHQNYWSLPDQGHFGCMLMHTETWRTGSDSKLELLLCVILHDHLLHKIKDYLGWIIKPMRFGIVSCAPCDFLRNAIIRFKIFIAAVTSSNHCSAPCLDIQFNQFSECLWAASNQVCMFSIGWVVHVAKQLVVNIKLNHLWFFRGFQTYYILLDQNTCLSNGITNFQNVSVFTGMWSCIPVK